LTNLETTTQKLLQVVLIGQPELAELLARRNLRQLSQRVTARYHLRSFSEEETQRYVQHRLEIAGQRQPIFTKQAVRAAHRLARGIPRLLNTICDRALLGAYATGQTRVKEAVVRRAAKEVLGPRRSRRWVTATAGAVLVLVVASTIALVATGGLRSLGAWAFSRTEKSISPPVDVPALAPVVDERRPPEPTLAAVLGDPSVTADRASAFVNLYALWGLDASGANAERGCELGRAAGLRCLSRIGTWTVLRRLNLPAILELTTPEGRKYHVVLAGLDGDRATLEIGARLVTLPSSEVERFWDGPFTMIWRSPVTGPVPIQPGMSGRDVAWLRQRLGALDGRPATARANQIYDDELKRRVAVFQQGEALMPDGIAGEETLVRLVATASGANGPTLTAERP
jgi:general secretion pathway protein A